MTLMETAACMLRALPFVRTWAGDPGYVLDAITWQPGEDGAWRPENYGSAFYPGAH
jgi:hypothetical protein